MFKFLKAFFGKSTPAPEIIPARGVIAKRESELFTIELIHKGGDVFEIVTMGKLTKTGSGTIRNHEHRAWSYFESICYTHNAK